MGRYGAPPSPPTTPPTHYLRFKGFPSNVHCLLFHYRIPCVREIISRLLLWYKINDTTWNWRTLSHLSVCINCVTISQVGGAERLAKEVDLDKLRSFWTVPSHNPFLVLWTTITKSVKLFLCLSWVHKTPTTSTYNQNLFYYFSGLR